MKKLFTAITTTYVAALFAWIVSFAAADTLLFSDDFESIPAAADNVPNVVLSAPAPILQWYNHFNNSGWQLGAGEGDLSVAMFPVRHNSNRWPDPSTPTKSSILSVGWAYESVQAIITLDLDQKWDSTKNYRLSFPWSLSDHGSKTGMDFKAVAYAYGSRCYQTNDFSTGVPVMVDAAHLQDDKELRRALFVVQKRFDILWSRRGATA